MPATDIALSMGARDPGARKERKGPRWSRLDQLLAPYLTWQLSEETLLGEGKCGPPSQEGTPERAARSRPLRAEVS